MRNRIIVVVMAAVVGIGSYVMGTMQARTVIEIQEVKKIIEAMPNNYIDMRQVVDFSTIENGLYLYTQDGKGEICNYL